MLMDTQPPELPASGLGEGPLPLDTGPLDSLGTPHQDEEMLSLESDTPRSWPPESVNQSPEVRSP